MNAIYVVSTVNTCPIRQSWSKEAKKDTDTDTHTDTDTDTDTDPLNVNYPSKPRSLWPEVRFARFGLTTPVDVEGSEDTYRTKSLRKVFPPAKVTS